MDIEYRQGEKKNPYGHTLKSPGELALERLEHIEKLLSHIKPEDISNSGAHSMTIDTLEDKLRKKHEDIRLYLASQALIGIMSAQPDADCGVQGYIHDAFTYADEMLKYHNETS